MRKVLVSWQQDSSAFTLRMLFNGWQTFAMAIKKAKAGASRSTGRQVASVSSQARNTMATPRQASTRTPAASSRLSQATPRKGARASQIRAEDVPAARGIPRISNVGTIPGPRRASAKARPVPPLTSLPQPGGPISAQPYDRGLAEEVASPLALSPRVAALAPPTMVVEDDPLLKLRDSKFTESSAHGSKADDGSPSKIQQVDSLRLPHVPADWAHLTEDADIVQFLTSSDIFGGMGGPTPTNCAGDRSNNSISRENESLKKQLQAAWQVCNILRSRMRDQELQLSPHDEFAGHDWPQCAAAQYVSMPGTRAHASSIGRTVIPGSYTVPAFSGLAHGVAFPTALPRRTYLNSSLVPTRSVSLSMPGVIPSKMHAAHLAGSGVYSIPVGSPPTASPVVFTQSSNLRYASSRFPMRARSASPDGAQGRFSWTAEPAPFSPSHTNAPGNTSPSRTPGDETLAPDASRPDQELRVSAAQHSLGSQSVNVPQSVDRLFSARLAPAPRTRSFSAGPRRSQAYVSELPPTPLSSSFTATSASIGGLHSTPSRRFSRLT